MIQTPMGQGSQELCPLKKCSLCKEEKPATSEYFFKKKESKDGLRYRCKSCTAILHKNYREKNKEKIAFRNKKYQENNKGKITKYLIEYRDRNRRKITEQVRSYERKRRKLDSEFRIVQNLRRRVNHFLKGARSASTLELLGCNVEYLKRHLGSQFTIGMTWDNYGEWHIDHIRPCTPFDLSDPDQQKQCFHYSNLQPMWAVENLSKGCKWEGSV
jgi:hypothetical protein